MRDMRHRRFQHVEMQPSEIIGFPIERYGSSFGQVSTVFCGVDHRNLAISLAEKIVVMPKIQRQENDP